MHYYRSHLTEEKTEAQRGCVIIPAGELDSVPSRLSLEAALLLLTEGYSIR